MNSLPIPLLSQLCQEVSGLAQIGGLKAFCKPVINFRQPPLGGSSFALVFPQPAQAGDGAQFKRLGPIALSNANRLLKTLLSLGLRGGDWGLGAGGFGWLGGLTADR